MKRLTDQTACPLIVSRTRQRIPGAVTARVRGLYWMCAYMVVWVDEFPSHVSRSQIDKCAVEVSPIWKSEHSKDIAATGGVFTGHRNATLSLRTNGASHTVNTNREHGGVYGDH